VFGVPLGISFFGTAFSEPTLIKLASGYEASTHSRAHNLPTFAATVPFDHIKGPLQQSGEGADAMRSAASVSSSAAQAAATVSGAAVAPAVATTNPAASSKAKRVLRQL